jgi:DNA-3-methyladenine glycosylase
MEGQGTMAKLRGVPRGSPAKVLTGGPGRLCKALGITRATHHDVDVTRRGSIVQILDDGFRPETIDVTPRIGIRKAADLPLRFVVGKPPVK